MVIAISPLYIKCAPSPNVIYLCCIAYLENVFRITEPGIKVIGLIEPSLDAVAADCEAELPLLPISLSINAKVFGPAIPSCSRPCFAWSFLRFFCKASIVTRWIHAQIAKAFKSFCKLSHCSRSYPLSTLCRRRPWSSPFVYQPFDKRESVRPAMPSSLSP